MQSVLIYERVHHRTANIRGSCLGLWIEQGHEECADDCAHKAAHGHGHGHGGDSGLGASAAHETADASDDDL